MPDLIAVEYSFLGRFAQGNGLEDLSKAPYKAAQFKDRFFRFSYDQTLVKGSKIAALPSDIGPGAMFYRDDILSQAGLSKASITGSWDAYIEAGKTIKEKTGAFLLAHARDIKDLVMRVGIPEGQGIYFDENGKSVVGSSPRFKQAFELAKKVRDNKLDAEINAWSNEWGELFKRGQVASQLMGAWLGGHLANWLAPETAGKWRAAQLPNNSYAAYGGTFLAIPAKAENKQSAWSLMQYLALDAAQQQMAFKNHDAFPALLSATKGGFFDQPIEFLGGQKARQGWREAAYKIKATKVFKHDAIAEEIVNTELDLVWTRGKAISKALADAQKQIARRARR